ELLEPPPHGLALEDHRLPRTRLQPHDLDPAFPAAVAPGVALSLAELPQTSHVRTVRPSPDGSCTATGASGALERGHRQAVVGELLPVMLSGFAMARPHDCPARVVDPVCDAQTLVV